MAFGNFYELDVWKRARAFKLKVYPLLKQFPAYEQHELTSQLRRAVRSVPANISEGHGRKTPKDELSFCIIARGSLAETLNHLIDAMDSGYIDKATLLEFKKDWDELRKVLNGYMSHLKSRIPVTGTSKEIKEVDVAYSFREQEELLEAFLSALE